MTLHAVPALLFIACIASFALASVGANDGSSSSQSFDEDSDGTGSSASSSLPATSFIVEHDLTPGQHVFSQRAELDLSGWSQWSKASDAAYSKGKLLQFLHHAPLTAADLARIKTLAEQDRMYTVRLVSRVGDATSTVYASVPACNLLSSNLQDVITVHLNTQGVATSISYSTASASCNKQHSLAENQPWKTKAYLAQALSVPEPYYPPVIRMPEGVRADSENKSFIQKYWMYIVPGLVIYMLLPQIAPAAGGEGGARRS